MFQTLDHNPQMQRNSTLPNLPKAHCLNCWHIGKWAQMVKKSKIQSALNNYDQIMAADVSVQVEQAQPTEP